MAYVHRRFYDHFYTTDASPPLILHDVMPLYQGALYENRTNGNTAGCQRNQLYIIMVQCRRWRLFICFRVSLGGDDYGYTIPVMDPGTWITYYFYSN